MRTGMKLTGAIVILFAVTPSVHAACNPLLAHDALVGQWKATVTADDGVKETKDNLEFKGGKFTSEAEGKDGFESATYEDNPAPHGMGAAKFEVTLKNKDGDTAKWSGTATAGEISGTLVITKKDGTSTTYTVKATRGN